MARGTLSTKLTKITRRTVDALGPGEKIRDTEIPGFSVRCFKDKKVYALKTFVSGRQRMLTIGTDGVMTPDAARKKALQIKGSVAAGDDPAVEREERRLTLTFGDVARRFLAEHCGLKDTQNLRAKFAVVPGAPVKPGTARLYRDSLRDHLLPKLANRTIHSVSAADLAVLHHRLQSRPTAANTMLSVVSVLHGWARSRKLRKNAENPADEIKRYPARRRTKFLNVDETKRLAAAISMAERGVPLEQVPRYKAKREKERAKAHRSGSGKPGPNQSDVAGVTLYSAAALRFLLLTGMRPQEALKLRWSDVDTISSLARLPNAKTGPREATLSTHALAFLETIPRIKGNPYVFCGARRGRPLASLQHAFELVSEVAGLSADVVLYTLRHNYGSTLAARRVEAYEIMKAMGHRNLSTSMRYIHLTHEGVREVTTNATNALAEVLNNVQNDDLLQS